MCVCALLVILTLEGNPTRSKLKIIKSKTLYTLTIDLSGKDIKSFKVYVALELATVVIEQAAH